MKRFILVSALLGCGLVSGAQVWTLQQCIDHALEHNISIRQQANQVALREIDLNTTKNSRLPGVSASASENLSFGRGLTQDNTYANTNTTSTGFSIGGDLRLFNGFSVRNNIALGELNLEAATKDLEKARNDVRVAVAQAYIQVLYNMEIVQVAENQVSRDSVQTDRLAHMLAGGKASKAEYARQKAAYGQSRMTLTQAQGTLKISLLTLTQLLELPDPEGFAVQVPSDEALDVMLPSPDFLYEGALALRPEVKAEELRLEGSHKSLNIARSSLYPSLSLNGGVGSNYYTSSNGFRQESFFNQLSNNFSQYVGVSLSVPIFSRFSTRNNVRSARVNIENQQLQLENVRKSLYKEIQQAYYNAVTAESKLQSSREALASAEESLDLMTGRYENGLAGITEYNDAKAEWLKAQSDMVQARWEYLFQTRLLNFYSGTPLSF